MAHGCVLKPARLVLTGLAEAANLIEPSAVHAQRDDRGSARSVVADLMDRVAGFAADSAEVPVLSAEVEDSAHGAVASVAAGWWDAEALGSGPAEQGAPRELAVVSAKIDAAVAGIVAASVDVVAVAVAVDVVDVGAVVGAAADGVSARSGARSDLADHCACQEKAAGHEETAATGSLGADPGIALAEKECGLAARCQCSAHASWPRLRPDSSAS
jgi:hypothetical protein